MICKKCNINISPDCIYDISICVFCYHNIKSWDSNGMLITKKEAIIDRCPNCCRNVPNQSWWKKRGCKWCQN